MKSLIIGNGEIGNSLFNVLSKYHDTSIRGKEELDISGIEIIHICFPHSKNFVKQVKNYQKKYKPKFTVIHSTVPVGVSRKCNAIHSPCIGVHPYLEESFTTFVKYLGGKDAGAVADYFRRANIKVYITDKQETTELIKILCTTFYGVCIEYFKDAKKQCDKYGVPFEFWTLWNDNYNKGYTKLGQEQFVRPNLVPMMKNINGHCIMPNTGLLDTEFTRLIRKLNEGISK